MARTLEPLKAKRMGMMLTIKSEPVDLSETIKELKQKIQKSTFEEFLYFFTALLNLESPEILLKEIEKSSPLASLFSSQTLDSKGRVIKGRCVHGVFILGRATRTHRITEMLM